MGGAFITSVEPLLPFIIMWYRTDAPLHCIVIIPTSKKKKAAEKNHFVSTSQSNTNIAYV